MTYLRTTLLLLALSLSALCAADAVQSFTVATKLSKPVCMIFSPLHANLAYVVEQGYPAKTSLTGVTTPGYAGRVRVLQIGADGRGTLLPTPLWMPSTPVHADPVEGSEFGMLSVLADPDFTVNRYLYVFYSASGTRDVLVRVTVSADGLTADPASVREIIAIDRDATPKYHHGSSMAFHPTSGSTDPRRRWLYLAVGNNDLKGSLEPSRNLNDLRGKILRIQVTPNQDVAAGTKYYEVPSGNPEATGWRTRTESPTGPGYVGALRREIIVAGIRNPWRMSFDGSGNLWVGVVGGGKEQIFRVPNDTLSSASMPGLNFGYPKEGVLTASTDLDVLRGTYVPPVFWETTSGNAFIGGLVYRGTALGNSWRGRYIFSNYQASLRALALDATSGAWVQDNPTELSGWLQQGGQAVVSLCEGPAREIYFLRLGNSTANGEIRRLDPYVASTTPPTLDATPASVATVGTPYVVDFTVSGTPAPTLTISAGSRGDMAITSTVGGARLTWTPTVADITVTPLTVTVTASNGTVPNAVLSWPITVSAAAPADIALNDPAGLLEPGLDSSYFDNTSGTPWPVLPDFSRLSATSARRVSDLSLAAANGDLSDFALRFSGYLKVTATGTYDLEVTASAGARVTVGSASLTTAVAGTPVTKGLALAAGYHRLLVDYAQSTGPMALTLRWRTVGGTYAAITGAQLARRRIAVGVDDYAPMAGYLDRRVPPTLGSGEPPARLSLTGAFSDVVGLKPAAGVLPYDVITPLWSDGASKRRWLAVPRGANLGFDAQNAWAIPAGAVFIKHFEAEGRRLETRLLVINDQGGAYGVSYKWRADGSDADLVSLAQDTDAAQRTITLPSQRPWVIPSRNDCMSCHVGKTDANGQRYFALGLRTHQLNATMTYPSSGRSDHQLRTLGALGLLGSAFNEGAISIYPKGAALADASASLELRVRSYIAANCAMCHAGGGDQNCPTMDARFSNAQAASAMIRQPTSSDISTGILSGAHMVSPGRPGSSMLLLRLNRIAPEPGVMPPLARSTVDQEAVALISAWITGLGAGNLAPTITLPATAMTTPGTPVTVTAVVTDDALLDQVPTLTWSQVSGPAPLTLTPLSGNAVRATPTQAGSYVVKADAFDGALHATATTTITVASVVGAPVLAVDAGLTTGTYQASDGTVFVADTTYLVEAATAPVRNTATTAGAPDNRLYSTYRLGPMRWRFPLANGSYELQVLMSDEFFTATGQRRFNVAVEQTPWLSNLDLVAVTGGGKRAYVATTTVTITDGVLNVDFTNGSANQPTVAGFRIRALPPPEPLFSARINFQPAPPVAAVPQGYVEDTGEVYDPLRSRNGLTYGWNVDVSADTRKRNSSPDPVLDTLIHLARGTVKTWTIRVPSGTHRYHVTVLAGDPLYNDSVNTLVVGGVTVSDPTPSLNADVLEVDVTVGGGFLTITQGAGGINAKLQAVEIVQIPDGSG